MTRAEKTGFTILEVIIALGILGLGLAAILQAFPTAVRSSRRSEYNSRAPLLAQQMMETLKCSMTEDGEQFFPAMHGQSWPRPFPAPVDISTRYYESPIVNPTYTSMTTSLPQPFPKPNEDMYWQVLCSRVRENGNFVWKPGPIASVANSPEMNGIILPGLWRVVVRVCWNSTGKTYDPKDDPIDGYDNDNDGSLDEDIPFDFIYDLECIIKVPKKQKGDAAE